MVALLYNKEFVDSISSGQLAGVLLDKTCFYAEQGGQQYDMGFMTKNGDEVRLERRGGEKRGEHGIKISDWICPPQNVLCLVTGSTCKLCFLLGNINIGPNHISIKWVCIFDITLMQ